MRSWVDKNLSDEALIKPCASDRSGAFDCPPVQSGTEGYTIVGSSVATFGAIFDAFIVEAELKNLFDQVSLTLDCVL